MAFFQARLFLFLGEPPLKVFLSKFFLFFFRFNAFPQPVTHLDEFLIGKRQPTALTRVAFRNAYVTHLSSAFRTVIHTSTPSNLQSNDSPRQKYLLVTYEPE